MKKLLSLLLVASALTVSAQDDFYLKRDGWSWYTSSDCPSEEDDIRGLAAIHDGDASTCWHTNWHAANGSAERSNPHWLMIDRGDDKAEFYGIAYLPRQKTPNQACTSWYLYVSDTPFNDVPATSADDIKAALGEPDYVGYWEGSIKLKASSFQSKKYTARYILFVNLTSYSSSSAACAEFNLLTLSGYENIDKLSSGTGTGTDPGTGGGGSNIPAQSYNAIKITNTNGQEHRIAVDGTNLSLSMNNGAVRLSNSGITVEYMPEEVEHFSFENYTFTDDPYYFGTKTDALAPRFNMVVKPADGKTLGTLSKITLAAEVGTLPAVNSNCTLPITLSRTTSNSTKVKLTVTASELAKMADDTAYVITDFYEDKVQTYILDVPAEMFIDANGAVSNPLTASWNLTGDPADNEEQVAIDEITANCPTLTLRREGSALIVGGITNASSISLVDMAGRAVASAPVGATGHAVLNISVLPKGVYILSANSTTLKISL